MNVLKLAGSDVGDPSSQPTPTGTNSKRNGAPSPEQEKALYVATDLRCWEGECPADDEFSWEDVWRDGTTYRRLDPFYLAWIRSRVDRARVAAFHRDVDPSGLALVLEKYATVRAWGVDHFKAEHIKKAEEKLNPGRYLSPKQTGHRFPAEGEWNFCRWVSADAVAKVQAIRKNAEARGWTEAQLFQNRGRLAFPCGSSYGLVCFLRWNQEVGEVAPDFIEILGPESARSRFYNHTMDHLWIQRGAGAATSTNKSLLPYEGGE